MSGENSLTNMFADEIDEWPANSEGKLVAGPLKDGICEIKLHVTEALERSVANNWFEGERPKPQTIMRLDYENGRMQIYPQITYFSDRLYRPKYDRLWEFDLPFNILHSAPASHFEATEILSDLPGGFIRDPQYGLGLALQMRPMVNAIEKLRTVSRFYLGDGEATRVEGATFYFNREEYATFATGVARIARRYQTMSLRDRELLAHNETLHRTMPEKFPFKEPPYERGTIYRLLGGSQAGSVKLHGKDRLGLLAAVEANASEIAARDPKEFVQLQKDIELVSLDRLIAAYNSRLKRNASERHWQELLELNPFILSMLFGQPIVLLQSGASVGGQNLAGGGTKIADFIAENPFSHNAALVELKTPKTPLCGSEYRGGVFRPSGDITGAIVQVLDQRNKLTNGLPTIKHWSGLPDLQTYSVECVIVAGRTPTEEAQRASFELMRGQLKDVRIITFDELLERLQLLRELLAGERYVSEIEDDDYDWDEEDDSNDPF